MTGVSPWTLERWLASLQWEYARNILTVDARTSLLWGRLRVPHAENPLDKLIAATALAMTSPWSRGTSATLPVLE